jgi:DNA-binding beta-propeller fold protein YncE
VNLPLISRRALLISSAAALGCGKKKATGYPGYCFVANREGRSLGVVDLNRFRLRKQIQLDAAPSTVIARPHAEKPAVFALAPDSGAVFEIDVTSLTVSRKASVGSQSAGMRLAPGGDALWILSRDPAALVELPLNSFRPARRIHLPAPPDGFDLSSDGHAAIERTIACAAEPTLIQFRSDGRQVLAGSAPERGLTIFDPATGGTVVRLQLPLAPRHFCVSPDGGQLFVTGDGMDAVVIVFPYSTEIDQTVLAGHEPGAMAVTATPPGYLLLSNPQSNSLTALDVDTRRLVAVVQVGQAPGQIVLTPDNQYALAVNEKSGDLAVVRLTTFAETRVRRYKSASLFTIIPVGAGPTGATVIGLRG